MCVHRENMMRYGLWAVNFYLAASLAIFSGCQKEAPHAFPSQTPIVIVSHPIIREVTDYEDFTGRLAAVESVEVRARVGGYLEKIGFEPGAEVKKGDILFQIDSRPFQTELERAK